jgi:hypothetical protein
LTPEQLALAEAHAKRLGATRNEFWRGILEAYDQFIKEEEQAKAKAQQDSDSFIREAIDELKKAMGVE